MSGLFFHCHSHRLDLIEKMTSIRTSNCASEGRRLTILYMTQTGTSSDLALRISRQAQRKRFHVTIADVCSYDPTDLVSESLVLFLVSTTGQGEFPTTSRPFWNFLLRKGIPEDILEDVTFAAFGLGDSTYPRFCWPVRLLSRRLRGLGAKELVEHGEGDDMHYLGLEGELGPWMNRFWRKLDELCPLEAGVREVGRDELLPPSVTVTKVETEEGRLKEKHDGRDALGRHLEDQGWSISILDKNQRMTATDHFQDVRLLEFVRLNQTDVEEDKRQIGENEEISRGSASAPDGISIQTYRPGDILCLHPINDAASVTEMLSRLDLDADTLVSLAGSTIPSTVPQSPAHMSVRDLLTHHLDFTSVPTNSFFEQIRLFSPTGSQEREKLDEYCGIFPEEELAKGANPQDGIDEMYEYAQRPRRTIKEVLDEFKSVQVPLAYIADVLPWIKPREFSIASAPPANSEREKRVSEEPHAIQLSVAMVKYKTRLRKARTGLCTRWLSSLPLGSRVPVVIKPGYLTLPPAQAPLILIGPGTGCAPLRSLVIDRLSNSTLARSEIHLFLGFRYRTKDYLFQHDWQHLQQSYANQFHLHTAFSRDGEAKTYVQDLIVKPDNAHVLWEAITERNAWIVVAGASGKMPEQVRGAFESIARSQGGMDEEQAKRFMDALERQRRWQEECWG